MNPGKVSDGPTVGNIIIDSNQSILTVIRVINKHLYSSPKVISDTYLLLLQIKREIFPFWKKKKKNGKEQQKEVDKVIKIEL